MATSTSTSRLISVLTLLWICASSIHRVESQGGCTIMDLAFVIDMSGSICDNDPTFNYDTDITCNNWRAIVEFVYGTVANLTIGPMTTNVALITFETTAVLRWNLTRYQDKPSLLSAIQNLTYSKGGQTNTTGALQILNTQVFNIGGDRADVNNTAIIITDGKPTQNDTVEGAINAVHQSGIRTLVVGITSQVDEDTLKLLSSPPKLANVTYFTVADYQTIDIVRSQLAASTCALPTTQSSPLTTQPATPVTPSCLLVSLTTHNSSPSSTIVTDQSSAMIQSTLPATYDCTIMDLAFVIDMSGSICDNDPTFNYDTDITCNNWRSIVQFVYQTVANLTIGPLETNVALITFETTAVLRWNLTRYQDKPSLLSAIQNLSYSKGGQTNTTGALQILNTQVFNIGGDRPNVNNTAIIITDGKPTQNNTVEGAINAVHQSGIRTLVVGITSQVDEATLKLLSSPPKLANVTYFMVADYQTIDIVRSQLAASTCMRPTIPAAITTQPSPPTTTSVLICSSTSPTTQSSPPTTPTTQSSTPTTPTTQSSTPTTPTAQSSTPTAPTTQPASPSTQQCVPVSPTTQMSSPSSATVTVQSSAMIQSTLPASYDCNIMDLAFVIDMSGSICDNDPTFNYDTDITCNNWRAIVEFVYQTAANLTIGPMETNVALITFETTAVLRWNLTRYEDKPSLLSAIQNLSYSKGGQTNTTGALQILNTQVFNIGGDRPNVNNTAIIITDGKPTQNDTVEGAINAVHQSGIRTLVVGITNQVDEDTLKLLSSPPKLANVTYFTVADYQTIDIVRSQLAASTCMRPTVPATLIMTIQSSPPTTTTGMICLSTTPTTQSSTPTTTTIRLSTLLQSSVSTPPYVCHAMDLAFVVDGSGSICDADPNFNYAVDTTCDNWSFIVQFIHRIVSELTIGPMDTRVALVTFSSRAALQWNLTRYTDKTSLLAAIDALPYQKGGQTDTTGGLTVLNNQVFNIVGDRPDINNTAILITDGRPTDNTTVQAAIDAVHTSGTRTLVVGVTNQVDEGTLQKLASPPAQLGLTYFVATDFDTIDAVRVQLTTQTCAPGTQAPTMPPMSPTAVGGSTQAPQTAPDIACNTLDLCFLVDASGSICDNDPNFDYTRDQTCNNWASILQFIHGLVSPLTIGPSAVRVALVTFASSARMAWGLGNYTDKASLLTAIDTLPYVKGGRTDTTGGLNLMNSAIFTTPDDNPLSNNTAIIITDGKPTVPETVQAAINAVHDRQIKTFAVGVTNLIDEATLQQLSSPPQMAGITYFMATDFTTLDAVKAQLQSQTCGQGAATTPQSSPPNQEIPCSDVLDLVFVVDGSGSICDNDANFLFTRDYTCQNWAFIVQFIHRIAAGLNVRPGFTKVAMVMFSSNARLVWGLNAYSDNSSLLYAIDNLMYQKGGTTDTTGGLNIVNTQVFNTPADRPNATNVAIIITDGKPTDPSTVQAAIDAVHASKIVTLVVGVTNLIDEGTLKQLSSPPQQINVTYFVANDYSMIDDVRTQLAEQTCRQGLSTTSTPSTPPSTTTPTTTTTMTSTPTTTTTIPTTPTTTTPTTTTPTTTTPTTTTPTTTTPTTTTPTTTTPTTTTPTSPASTGTTPIVCTEVMDLCLVIDGSGSICDTDPTFNYDTDITCNNWNLILQFLVSIVQDLSVGLQQIRVAMVVFETTSRVAWKLTDYTTEDLLINAINNLPYHKGGRTDTTGALDTMRTMIFGTADDRPNANNTAIIVTDGRPTNTTTVPAAIAAVHAAGIRTLVVGVTDQVDEATLKQLSSPPQTLGETYFMATGFDALQTVLNVLKTKTCG